MSIPILNTSTPEINIRVEDELITFKKAALTFVQRDIESVFITKNNKSVLETLEHKRYKSVLKKIGKPTFEELAMPLGDFLLKQKTSNNLDYKFFLNRYGDSRFCHFKLNSNLNDKGIYAWVQNNEIKYIGRCNDSFKKRVNQGYGRINAKNCFLDGQATNCHLNSKINNCDDVDFYVYVMNDKSAEDINALELKLLKSRSFDWNIQNNMKF